MTAMNLATAARPDLSHEPHSTRGTRAGITAAADRLLDRPGLLLKRLTLAIGGVFLTFVCVTNLVNFFGVIGAFDWTFLNSGNDAFIHSVTKVYSMPPWFDHAAVLTAAIVEGVGAFLFWRAVARCRGGRTGRREAWFALIWNIAVWLGFIAGTEFFVAYTSESPFRELLIIGLLMAVVFAVVPDDVGTAAEPDRSAS
jgi:hypothetical protein